MDLMSEFLVFVAGLSFRYNQDPRLDDRNKRNNNQFDARIKVSFL